MELPELSIFSHMVQLWFLIFPDVVPFTGSNREGRKIMVFREILKITFGSLELIDAERRYLPITPRPSPLHLTPWVPDADQLNLSALIINLKESNSG